MRTIIPTAAALLMMATLSTPAVPKAPEGEANQPTKVSLRLKPSASKGYAPMTVTLDGDLAGANLDDLRTCLLSEEWIGETNISHPPNTKHTIPCVTSPDDWKDPRKFQREVTLQEPGTYIYQILFTPGGHRTTASRTIEIRVFPNQFETKATGNR